MTCSFLRTRRWARGVWVPGVLTLAGWAQAACPSVPTTDRFVPNGAEVTDLRTGLVWQRCSLGQAWNGSTCTGSASTHTHEEALAQARAANPSGGPTGWRLPNVKELSSLVDRGCLNPAVDQAALPATPASFYWTSSPYVGSSGRAWIVNFHDGSVAYSSRSNRLPVRLVRASQ